MIIWNITSQIVTVLRSFNLSYINKNLLLMPLLFKHRNLCTQLHNINLPFYLSMHPNTIEKYGEIFIRDLNVYTDFITEDEEKSLCTEIESIFKKRRYEVDHWDDAIHGYRETDRLKWNPINKKVIEKIRLLAFPTNTAVINHVHILDLADYGFIKPHVDSVRFCGSIIASLSLLSDSIMRFLLEEDKTIHCDVLLKRRSLYVMKDDVRFKFSHQILKKEESIFKDNLIDRSRRISLICRSEPEKCKNTDSE